MDSILFVDDDPAILRSMRREFADEYDVIVGESAEQGLELLKARPTIQVCVTDHNMPGMTGLGFVEAVKSVSETTEFILLTGNHELDVATAAANADRLFRMLRKPCDTGNLKVAIDDAIRRGQVRAAEQQLLQKTFVGGISVVAGIIESALPEFSGVAPGVVGIVDHLCEELGIPSRWEYRISARLCLLGFSGLEAEPGKSRFSGVDVVASRRDEFREATAKSAKQLGAIPRLELVAKILETFPDSDGAFCSFKPKSEGAVQEVGASLIRIGLAAETLLKHGVSTQAMVVEIKELLPGLVDQVVTALGTMPEQESPPPGDTVPVNDLQPGMVLAADLHGVGGGILARRGTRLSETHVANICSAANERRLTDPIVVTTTSLLAMRNGSATHEALTV